MTSKIINMADRIKDEDDLALEAMFRSDPIRDDGFSAQVTGRVRRQIWVRRLSLPLGISVGLAISAKPIIQLASVIPGLVNSVFGRTVSLDQLPLDGLPQATTVLLGASLVMAVMLASRILEE